MTLTIAEHGQHGHSIDPLDQGPTLPFAREYYSGVAAPRRPPPDDRDYIAMKNIAVVCTVYGKNSHADVIAGKFMRGFPTDDGVVAPQVKIVSMYIDQLSGEN